MLRRERVRPPVTGETSALLTIPSAPQQVRRVVRAKPRLVKLFLAGLVLIMAQTQDKVVVHPTPTGIILASANVTTMITASVPVRTPISPPVAQVVAGGRADGGLGARAVSVVVGERRPARIAAMGRSKPKPATPKPAADGGLGARAAPVVVGERRPVLTPAMARRKRSPAIHSPVDVRLAHGRRAVLAAAGEHALAPTRVRPAGSKPKAATHSRALVPGAHGQPVRQPPVEQPALNRVLITVVIARLNPVSTRRVPVVTWAASL